MDMARDAAGFKSIPADPRETTSVCGWDIARVVYGSETATLRPGEANMQCPLAVGSYMWLREANMLAITHLGQWSEHAFANAWDITGFELEDGRMISVLKDWNGNDKTRQKFLRGARDKACKIFRVTLSPDYNAAHRDHFHVDMGPSSACR